MHFKFFNIPVYVHPSFWIFLLFFTNAYQTPSVESLILGGIMMVSLLIHEYGHAITAAHFGARPTIHLEAFGGSAQYNGFGMTLKQHFLITLNGPLLESLLIFIPYFLLKTGVFQGHYYLEYTLQMSMRLNILWCLLNLIPVAPLDGGYLARYLLERKFGERGQRASLWIGVVAAAVTVPYLCYQGFVFFGMLVALFGFRHFQMLKSVATPQMPFNAYLQGVEAIKNDDVEKGKAILRRLLKSKDNQIRTAAAESLAKVYLKEGDHETPYRLLLESDHQFLKDGKTLLCKLAFEQKNYALIGRYARDMYAAEPSFETALLNSKAFARLGELEESGGWLKTASLFGDEYKAKVPEILEDQSYDGVRNEPDFLKNYTSS